MSTIIIGFLFPDFRHYFFLFILQGVGRPPSQVLGEGARPVAPPLVASLLSLLLFVKITNFQ